MNYTRVLWDLEDEPDGNVQHVAEHGLTIEEVEDVLADPVEMGVSHSTGKPMAKGWTSTGKWIIVVFVEIDEDTIRPVTAYEPGDADG
jgi:uncharacterized DUF497 family protein